MKLAFLLLMKESTAEMILRYRFAKAKLEFLLEIGWPEPLYNYPEFKTDPCQHWCLTVSKYGAVRSIKHTHTVQGIPWWLFEQLPCNLSMLHGAQTIDTAHLDWHKQIFENRNKDSLRICKRQQECHGLACLNHTKTWGQTVASQQKIIKQTHSAVVQ